MKAIRMYEFGGPDVLKYEDAPEPQPKQDEVLVKVHAIGLNYADILTRMGAYLTDAQFPFIPGFEAAEAQAYVTSRKNFGKVVLRP